ncbi:MAG: site-specific integrase [Fimbriimonadales bacterium]|nr:MAG: site-specific integrase [Fimbriimonadales bacterium]
MTRKRHRTQYAGIWYRLVNEARPDGPRRYIVGYTDANGNYHTETLPVGSTLEDARRRRGELMAKRRTFVPTSKTVGELLDEYLEIRRHDLRETTLEAHEWAIRLLKEEFGRKRVRDLTANDIARLIASAKSKGMKTSSIKRVLSPLSGALRVAVREGWIQSNPIETLLPHERPKPDQREMRCLSSDEISKLLEAASSDQWRTLFSTLIFTGLRISEALALTWNDIDFHDSCVLVRKSKTEAGERKVMLIPSLATVLKKHRLAQAPGTEHVFATRDGKPLSRRDALRALHAAEKRAGIPKYTLHELRHTFASILISQGEAVTLIAHQMGHADPSVTLRTYAHLFDAQENIARARDRLQEAFGGVF